MVEMAASRSRERVAETTREGAAAAGASGMTARGSVVVLTGDGFSAVFGGINPGFYFERLGMIGHVLVLVNYRFDFFLARGKSGPGADRFESSDGSISKVVTEFIFFMRAVLQRGMDKDCPRLQFVFLCRSER